MEVEGGVGGGFGTGGVLGAADAEVASLCDDADVLDGGAGVDCYEAEFVIFPGGRDAAAGGCGGVLGVLVVLGVFRESGGEGGEEGEAEEMHCCG